jgi:uncharacterized protein YbaR (Trm112 family)
MGERAVAVEGSKSQNQEANVVDPKLLEFLVCPLTKSRLLYDAEARELISPAAGLAFPIRNGVPLMIEDAARKLTDDDLRRLCRW